MRANKRRGGAFMRASAARAEGRLCGENLGVHSPPVEITGETRGRDGRKTKRPVGVE